LTPRTATANAITKPIGPAKTQCSQVHATGTDTEYNAENTVARKKNSKEQADT